MKFIEMDDPVIKAKIVNEQGLPVLWVGVDNAIRRHIDMSKPVERIDINFKWDCMVSDVTFIEINACEIKAKIVDEQGHIKFAVIKDNEVLSFDEIHTAMKSKLPTFDFISPREIRYLRGYEALGAYFDAVHESKGSLSETSDYQARKMRDK